MSLILMTTLFYKALILHVQREIWYWSLLELKGLIRIEINDNIISILLSFSDAHQL